MPPKSATKKSDQPKEIKKKVIIKEESNPEQSSESEDEVVKHSDHKKETPKKTPKKVTKKEELKQNECEEEKNEQKEVVFQKQDGQNYDYHEQDGQDELVWTDKLSDNEQKDTQDNELVQEQHDFNKNNRNDKRFQKQNRTERTKSNFKPRKENQTEEREEKTFAKYNMNSGKRVGINKNSQALKFSYNEYDNVVNPVFEVSTEDLIKVLIARSFKEGQMTLKRSLENVLRAMNHECNFPTSNQ